MEKIKITKISQVKATAKGLTKLWDSSTKVIDFKAMLSLVDIYNLMVLQTLEHGRSFKDSIENAKCHIDNDNGATYLRYFSCYK